MNILLLGGSNAGLRDGWAAQLHRKAPDLAIENQFLGAVGSLYGLMALLKRGRDDARKPDLVVFEYCLNDVLLVDAGVVRPALIFDALEAVIDICARARLPLLFLCLRPRPDQRRGSAKSVAAVVPLYKAAARRAGAPILWLEEIFEGALTAAQYQDENHLTPSASARIADAVLAAILGNVPAPRSRADVAPRFLYVDATQASGRGELRTLLIETRVFEGPFIELARGGSSLWPGRDRLVGLMLQSTAKSGIYSIRAEDKVYRKNPCSKMQENVPNLVLLHYTTRRIEVRSQVEITMPDDETELMRLPEDQTLLEAPATAPFAEQTLRIHGLMFWRPRSLLERLWQVFPRD